MTTKKTVSIIIITFLAGFLIGFGIGNTKTPKQGFAPSSSTPAKNSSPMPDIKLGVMLPLTGDLANLGASAKAGTEVAIEEINSQGGINGSKIRALIEDSKCQPKDSASIAQKFISIDKVNAILGDICSGDTLAASPIVEAAATPLISPCSSNPDITNAGDYIFRVFPSDAFQGVRAAEHAKNELHFNKAAILYVNNAYGNGLKETFKKRFLELGGEIATEEGYGQGSNDLRTQLLKIKEANPEIVYFPSYTEDAIVGLKQKNEIGAINAIFLGTDAWADPKLFNETRESAEGTEWLEVKSYAAPQNFQTKMAAKLGTDEIPACGPQSYDIVYLLKKAIENSGETAGAGLKNELYKTKLQGISGDIEFDQNGDLKKAEYVIKTVQNGKVEELE
jgi:branched-chain amino acid transport system substrate-binding protein